MKRVVIALCLFAFVFACLFPVFADGAPADGLSEYGAVSVESEVRKELGLTDGETVFKLYNCPVVFAFGGSAAISEVLKSDIIYQTFYAVPGKDYADGGWKFFTESNGSLVEIKYTLTDSIGTALAFLTDDGPVKEFSGAETVVNKFFFFNPTMYQGTAIYYQTEKGDFVYYDRSNTGRMLFTAEEFYGITADAFSRMGPDTPMGGTDAGQAVKTTGAEDIDGEESTPTAWIIVAVVVAAVAAAAVILVPRLKKRAA